MKLTPEQEKRLIEAATSLRCSPAFAPIEKHLIALLDETKHALVFNQSALVPNLQGRAQQLIDILELLNRKTK